MLDIANGEISTTKTFLNPLQKMYSASWLFPPPGISIDNSLLFNWLKYASIGVEIFPKSQPVSLF